MTEVNHTISMFVQTKHLPLLQTLLGRWNGRLLSPINPKTVQAIENCHVIVGFETAEMYYAFNADYTMLTQEIKEVDRRDWKIKAMRRLAGEMKYISGYFDNMRKS